ncbi:bZIP transcription factor TGA10-like [Nicotiana tabacum]|uniref:BZIP transcription factor TGA10-like n=2 Tax=Nicotiana TaxID=4085 RepID=A0A1S3ZGP2_TOBAC|nr:PREDICTED: transcription factor HBP-1b(c38)-like [Nicotiana sylvestris]XP_016463456.1 PREDICTED: transcription factor HBP-1b(c38)-like [Nicotiana tabacum]
MGFQGSYSTEEENKLFIGVHFMASSNKSNDDLLLNNNSQISFGSSQQQFFHSPQQQHDQHQLQNNSNQISFGLFQQHSSSSSNPGNFINKDNSGAYDLGELDQALFLYLDGQEPSSIQDQRHNSGVRPPTLNIFPSQPMHIEPSSTKANNGLVSQATSGSNKSSQPSMAKTDIVPSASGLEPPKTAKREGIRKGPTSSSEQDAPKTPDPKTLRRLAQNREAARKSRLRKKAYVQQLESSRIRLAQLEQEIQRARSQGFYVGGNALQAGEQALAVNMANISSDAAIFDLEYARWLEEHHRLMCELRNAVQEHLQENELRIYVENCITHYDEIMNLKCMLAKSDVFHLVSGLWKTPAERCFLWMGDFRPSELLKIILSQIEPLTENQLMGICGLQQSTQEAEDALSQGLESLNQSLSDTIASDALACPQNMANYMGQMALAMNKLSTVEGFLRQADNLRHQTIHRLHQILTTRQAARCFLAIGEYFHRLRALSSLWLARPRQE